MLVFLIHTYRFFQKHKIVLWLLILAVLGSMIVLLFSAGISMRNVQYMIFPVLVMFLLMLVFTKNSINSVTAVLFSLVAGTWGVIILSDILPGFDNISSLLGFIVGGFTCTYSAFIISRIKTGENRESVIKDSVISITQRSLATAAAFLCLMFSGDNIIRQIGLLSGINILVAALLILFFLPHLVRFKKVQAQEQKSLLNDISKSLSRSKWLLVILIITISLLFIFRISGTSQEKEIAIDAQYYLMMILIPAGLTFFFGRIELGIISSLPLFAGMFLALGIKHFFGIAFGEETVLVFAIIFGIGADYSVQMTGKLINEYRSGNKDKAGDSIFHSFILSIVVICFLLLIGNEIIFVFTCVAALSLLVTFIACHTVQPMLFNFLVNAKNKRRRMPMTFTDIIFTMIAFTVFLGGCLTLNILLPVILILPVRKKIKKIIMHYMMMGFCRFEVYLMFNVKKKIINVSKEDFRKPSLIIANHQSHIDLLLLLMLHPKMIVITNKWVWNNPVYSAVIRYIDFYSISEGYENIMEKLKEKIFEGYSILIFPEGSRSEDSRIMRFHKGAFVVAEQLNLEIVPIIIHGVGDCMNKGENFLKSGTITIKIFDRIKPDDKSYGEDYSARTKSVLKYFRSEYAKMAVEYATPQYFRRKLLRNYIYKGPVLEWYSKSKTGLEKNYELFDSLVPHNATVVDMGCGYGFLSYMLGMTSDKRKITGVDYDPVKIRLANNCAAKNESINFVHSDILTYDFLRSDAFILLDVLHYFSEEKQEQLLNRIMKNLNENGVIIIRDAEPKHTKRHWGTIYTEWFSSFTGFNIRSSDTYHFISAEKIKEIISCHGMKMEIVDNSRFTSNLIYVIRK